MKLSLNSLKFWISIFKEMEMLRIAEEFIQKLKLTYYF